MSPYFCRRRRWSVLKLDHLRSQDTAVCRRPAGGGLEIRLGQHFVLNADLRGDGRYRMTGSGPPVTVETQKVNGVVLSPMGNQYDRADWARRFHSSLRAEPQPPIAWRRVRSPGSSPLSQIAGR